MPKVPSPARKKAAKWAFSKWRTTAPSSSTKSARIPTSVQAKLLRVLEEKIVMRIGQERYIPINVRIVCATNKDLAELVRAASSGKTFSTA